MKTTSSFVVWLLWAVFASVTNSFAINYHFSALGNDTTGNGTLESPWKSISKFNTLNLNPGDQALFRAGDTFSGNLYLAPDDTGNNSAGLLVNPITIGSYQGSGTLQRAIISSPTGVGLFSYNNGGIQVRNLEFHGTGSNSSNSHGIYFYQDEYGSPAKQESVQVDNVIVDGFGRWGVLFETDRPTTGGYRGVRVTNSELRNNRAGGLSTVAANWTGLAYEEVYVGNVSAYQNPGYSGCSPHCGHGIVLGQVDNAVIERSTAYQNGIQFGKGNVGIWTWQSNNVTIQHNVSYSNRSPAGGDGGGFDLDGGVTNSVVQYNRSYDNDGAGYLLAQFGYAEPMSQNVFRYNLSSNDGRDDYGAITVWGETSNDVATSAVFHNNTIILDKSVAPNSAGVIKFLGQHHAELSFVNNVFVAASGADLIDGDTATNRSAFTRNLYWTEGAPIKLEGSTYSNLAAWANASGQEMLAGQFVGIEANPCFANDVDFRPLTNSPLLGTGLDAGQAAWPEWLDSLGGQDFWGTVPGNSAGVEIGAVEVIPGDFNGDGQVGSADLIVWISTYGQSGKADADFDGDSDGRDLLLWQRLIDQGAIAKMVLVVPETTGLTLAGIPLGILVSLPLQRLL